MSVTVNDVKWAAQLARLTFSSQEEEQLAGELNRILEYMAKLNELDTEGVEPTSHAVPLANAFRSDQPKLFADPEALLEPAPQRDDSYFKVPRIIE